MVICGYFALKISHRNSTKIHSSSQAMKVMGSFTNLSYHIVFGTKYRRPLIEWGIRKRLYEYIGGIVRGKKGHQIEIGGVADHIHILAQLSAVHPLADVIRDVKSNSSTWMRENCSNKQVFEWQKGYGAFTVSYSMIDNVVQYIRNQPEHHRKVSFQEEYEAILTRHNISFRREYLFEDEHLG